MSVESNSNLLDNADPDLNHYGDFTTNFTTYDLDTLKGNINANDGFNLMHHNSRSLLAEGRVEDYEVLLDSLNSPFHVLGFSETWLKLEDIGNVSFYGYEHVYSDRPVSTRNEDSEDKEAGGAFH